MAELRPFEASPEAYARVLGIRNRYLPMWARSLTTLQYMDAHPEPGLTSGRAVMVEDGEIVACIDYFEPPWSGRPGKFVLDCFIEPELAGSPRDRALVEAGIDFVQTHFGARSVAVGVMADRAARLSMLDAMGFEQEIELNRSVLDVGAFEAAPFGESLRKAEAHGVRVECETVLKAADPDYIRKMWRLEHAISHDIPSSDPVRERPLSSFAMDFVAPWNIEGATFVALVGDEYVGMSTLKRAWADPSCLAVGVTGVRREHRRRGIATLLKICGIEYARGVGVGRLETMNEVSNPMYHLNLALGFEVLPSWLGMLRRLG